MPKCRGKYKDEQKYNEWSKRNRKKNYDKTNKNGVNRHARWDKESIKIIMLHDIHDREISKIIGRTVRAIQGKRCKLMKADKIDTIL